MEKLQVVVPCALRKGGPSTLEIIELLLKRYKPKRPERRDFVSPVHARVYAEKKTRWYNFTFSLPRDEVESFKKECESFFAECVRKKQITFYKKIKVRNEPPKGSPVPGPTAA